MELKTNQKNMKEWKSWAINDKDIKKNIIATNCIVSCCDMSHVMLSCCVMSHVMWKGWDLWGVTCLYINVMFWVLYSWKHSLYYAVISILVQSSIQSKATVKHMDRMFHQKGIMNMYKICSSCDIYHQI